MQDLERRAPIGAGWGFGPEQPAATRNNESTVRWDERTLGPPAAHYIGTCPSS